jgi:hypothetical protein
MFIVAAADMSKVRKTRLDFFTDNALGHRVKTLRRHPENDRLQLSVVEKYAKGLESTGLVAGVRGQLWAVEGAVIDGLQHYDLITYGTLTSAMYVAADRSPDNPMVKSSVEAGVEDCIILHSKTPLDVVRWMRDFHNQWHGGQGYTIMQFFKDELNL